jgi:hypothetical protein
MGNQATRFAASGFHYFDIAMRNGALVLFEGATPKVIQVVFPTNSLYTELYAETNDWWKAMNTWADGQLASAPPELNGAFVSVPFDQLLYFALQQAMAESSAQSAIIALVIACIVLTFFTSNLLIALYTTLTVVLIIITVSGMLLSAGWEQGIMESIIISCGIGMACDFAAHIGFAYRQANKKREAPDRSALARLAIRRMMPALTAAAFSTALMAIFMMQAGTLFTVRFGIFISMLMGFGWLYATFFLIPCLATIGPLGNCGELPKVSATAKAVKRRLSLDALPPPPPPASAKV